MLIDLLRETFVLNPVLALRPDKKRAILFCPDAVEVGKNYFTKFLSPRMAIFLALFDGEHDLDWIIRLWARLTDQAYPQAIRETIGFMEAHRDLDTELLIPAAQAGPQYRRAYGPEAFISDSGEVDLVSARCYMPISYTHEICYRCVTNCVYCYSDLPRRKGTILPLARLRDIVTEARQLGIPNVGMSGGDPFCHPQIFDVFAIYSEAGIRVDVPTKTPLKERELYRLKEMPSVRLQFSMDGVEPEINDWLVGVKGHTERMKRTLHLAKKVGLRFSFNAVLTAYNYRQAMDLIPFLMENFGEQVKRISLTPYGQSIYRHRDEFFIPRDAFPYLQERIAYYKEKYPQPHINFSGELDDPAQDLAERKRRYDARSQCTANRTGFVLLPDGKVTVCEELYYHPAFLIGDLAEQSIMEMWESEAAKALADPCQAQVPDGPCATCPEFGPCHTLKGRCYKRALQAYGYDKPHWPDPTCPYTGGLAVSTIAATS